MDGVENVKTQIDGNLFLQKRGKQKMSLSPLEAEFLHKWQIFAPGFPVKYDKASRMKPFAFSGYKYQSDFVFDQNSVNICLELQGSTWSGGKHGRGSGISIDAKKLYYAQVSGWMLIQIPSGEVDEYLPLVLEAIILRGGLPVVKEKSNSVTPVLAGNPF